MISVLGVLALLVYDNAHAQVANGGSCNNSGMCDSNSCQRSQIESQEYCCASSTPCNTPCYDCQGDAGVCNSRCTTPGGCTNMDGDCADLTCANVIIGGTATSCTWYTSAAQNLNKFCLQNGGCAVAPADCGAGNQQTTSCVSAGCLRPGVCVAGQPSTPIETVSGLCFEDNTQRSCAATATCKTGGACVDRVAGDACSMPAHCGSGLTCNDWATQQCCPSACSQCQTCSGSTCQFVCALPGGCVNPKCTTNVPCNDIIKGWVGGVCEKYSSSPVGRCGDSSGCVTTATENYCSTASTATAAQCADVECKRSSVCTPLSALTTSDTTAKICFTSKTVGQGSCTNDRVCDATGACVKLALGEACSINGNCMSGNCVDGFCCSMPSCGPCRQCTGAAGTCVSSCASPTGCPSAMCSPVSCENRAAGWMSNVCQFYAGGADTGRCKNDGTCYGATEEAGCVTRPKSSTPATTCVEASCRDDTKCMYPQDTSSYTPAIACLQSGSCSMGAMGVCTTGGDCKFSNGVACSGDGDCQSGFCRNNVCCSSNCDSNCGDCSTGTCLACTSSCNPNGCAAVTIDCNNRIQGWSSNDCLKYTGDRTNVRACSLGQCATTTTYSLCSTQATTTAITGGPCVDSNCRILSGCVPNNFVSGLLVRNTVCDLSGTTMCGTGLVCRTNGMCAAPAAANGAACVTGADCTSGFCSPQNVCCNEACTSPCGSCNQASFVGTCRPTCSTAGGCPNAACPVLTCAGITKGFNGGVCEKYSGNTMQGVCSNTAPACAAINDYQFCYGPVMTHYSCASSQCNKACLAGNNAASQYPLIASVCNVAGETCGAGARVCSASGYCGLPLGDTTCSVNADCISLFCVATSAVAKVCCDAACTGECSACSGGTCTSCSTGPPTGCPTTYNSMIAGGQCTMNIPCDQTVAGWNGNVCEKYNQNLPARCSSGNTCVATNLAFCAAATRVATGAPQCASPLCKRGCTVGAPATSHDTLLETCHTDGLTSCGAGLSCGAGGACLRNNNQACAYGVDDALCLSGFCGGNTGSSVCCAVPCSNACFTCTGGTTCTSTCSSAAGCPSSPASVCNGVSIACTDRVSGWVGNACHKYTATTAGRCRNGGGCTTATDYAYCSGTTVATFTCGSPECKKACVVSAVEPTLFDDVCHVTGRQGCSMTQSCDSTGTCKTNFAQACTASSQCFAGAVCHRNVCCSAACGPCLTCDATGACVVPTCTNPNGCAPTNGDCPGLIGCSSVLAGWQSNSCHRYNTDPARLCRMSKLPAEADLCTPTNLYTWCQTLAVPTAVAASCDAGCRDATKCVQFAALNTGDANNKVCFTSGQNACSTGFVCTFTGICNQPGGTCMNNGDCSAPAGFCQGATTKFCCSSNMCSHPCNNCLGGTCGFRCTAPSGCAEPSCSTQISCNNRVKGWAGVNCERYNADSPGLCVNGGLCSTATDYAYCAATSVVAVSCVHAECVNTATCTRGAVVPTMASQVCHTDGSVSCAPTFPGSVCGPAGRCLKVNGQSCSVGTECLSTICQQGVCCNELCGAPVGMPGAGKLKECFKCNLAGSLGTCTNENGGQCGTSTSVPCDTLLHGWVGSACHKYSTSTFGTCSVAGDCTTPNTLCVTNNVPTVTKVTCLASACVDAARCVRFQPEATATVATECKDGIAEATCAAVACNSYVAGWNQAACEQYGAATVSGQCLPDSSCAPAAAPASLTAFCPPAGRTAAFSCGSAACNIATACSVNTLTSGWSVANSCQANVDQAACPDITCTGIVSGWMGAQCRRYSVAHLGRCGGGGLCETSASVWCKSAASQVQVPITGGLCPTAFCTDTSKCQEGQAVTANDQVAEICLINTPEPRCNDLTCVSRTSGIVTSTCFRFTLDSTGHCDATSNCITQCTAVPAQNTAAIASCGSQECLRMNACPANADIGLWNTTAKLCFVSDEDAACANGARCDTTGTCRFLDTGGSCSIDDNCRSKFCWKDPTMPTTNPGICCSAACKGDCEECATVRGTCRARTGEVCAQPPRVATATPLDCPSFIRGWGSGPDINTCFKYARQRTQECTAGATCSNSPALCPVVAFNTGAAAHLLPCVSSACKQSCNPGDSIATATQNNICFTNEVVAGCTDIGCRQLVSGWSGATCRKWNLDHVGYCESSTTGTVFSGRCSSDVSLCAMQASQTEVQHQQCANVNCVVATACQTNTPLTANNFTTVCNTNVVVDGCPDILCSNYVRGWNVNTCERYQSNHPGYCTATGDCDNARSRCNTMTGIVAGLGASPLFTCASAACKLAGACVVNSDNPTMLGQVCKIDALEPNCPDIACNSTVRGWNGATCERFSKDFSGWCLTDTSCDSDVRRCDRPEAITDGVAAAPIVVSGATMRCGSLACTKAAACQRFSAVTSSDTIDEICSVSTDVAACGAPHTFPCAEFITGWNANTCERFSVNSAGHCNATSSCITSCPQVPMQTRVLHRRCGHIGCVRNTTCNAGEQSTLYPTVASVCFTDNQQHGCVLGAKCNSIGDCVFANDGQQCSINEECGSKVCWKRPANSTFGICCSRACSNECEECASTPGSCLPRTGADCSFDVKCTTALKGFSLSSPNRCQRYRDDRKGVCTASGVCGNAIQLCGTAAGVDQISCAASQCAKTCTQYANVSTALTVAQACNVAVNHIPCTDIDCTQFIAGWSRTDATVCQKYSSVHTGYCDTMGGCSQDPATCQDTSIVTRTQHLKCGDVRCQKACVAGTTVLAAAQLADVCIVNAATTTCPVLSCSTRLKGWLGRACQKYQIDRPGSCNAAAVCETNFATCSSLPGETHQRCGSDECAKSCSQGADASVLSFSDVCAVNRAEPACADIPCVGVIKGWNGAVCERWSTDNAGYCDADSRCSESTAFCSGTSVPIAGADCGSSQCRRAGGCFPGAPILFAASRAHVCDISVDNANCPPLACASLLAGWNSNVCTRYVRETGGYCDASATCLSNCKLVPAQAQVEVVRCASLGCVRADKCVTNDPIIAAGSVAAVCYTDRMQHNCPMGAVCNAQGACVFPDAAAKKGDNSLCSSGADCTSGFCVLSDEKMNICCNTACSGPCVQCVSGVCQPKVGAPCGDGVCKACDESGVCQTRTTLCAEKSRNGTGLFLCNTADRQCLSGQCVACAVPVMPPDISKAPNSTVIIKPAVDCVDAIDCGGGPTVAVPAGVCMQGKCVCNTGFTGKYCEGFSCDPKFNCNTRSTGGTCTGANTCTCNNGFSAPNCVATCAGNATASLAPNCSGHGWCSAPPSNCVCDAGWTKADCSMPAMLATPCADDSQCDTRACFKVNANDTMGICCATQCNRECNTCAGIGASQEMRGFCQPLVGQPCGNSRQCSACVLGNNGLATCGKFSSLCADVGGMPGSTFGCTDTQFCFDGDCANCAEPSSNSTTVPIECGTGRFGVNFKFANPKLPLRVCSGDQNDVLVTVNVTVPTCALAWMPGKGVGVDCDQVDGLLSGRANESLKITFAPPLVRRFNLTLNFDPFIMGRDEGFVKVTHVAAMMRRRQENNDTVMAMTTETTLSIMSATLLLDDQFDQISALEITAVGAMSRFALLSLETAPRYVTPPTTTTTTTTETTTTTTTGTTEATTTTEAPETDADVLQRIKDGFAGNDTAALGLTIGALALIVICIIACVVVGVALARRRAANQKLAEKYGEGKPMQSFETVTAKPSTALGDDSDDEAPFGMLPSANSTISSPPAGIKVEPLSSDED